MDEPFDFDTSDELDEAAELSEMDQDVEPMFGQDLPDDHRSGFVALIGKPNVGKSTLLNTWLGTKIAPVSDKPQTTRDRLLGILTEEHAQVVFVDTPGLHLPRTELGRYMVDTARRAIPDADVVLFMVDMREAPNRADQEIAGMLQNVDAPVILVLNKMDLAKGSKGAERIVEYEALGDFAEIYPVSALTGQNVAELLESVTARLPLGPRFYPEDQISDQQLRQVAAELIREQLLQALQQEVPHALAVVVDEFVEEQDGPVSISALIYCEKDSQKGIIIGHKGSMIKQVSRNARRALQDLLNRRVELELWVKVRKNWRGDKRFLRQIGYGGEE